MGRTGRVIKLDEGMNVPLAFGVGATGDEEAGTRMWLSRSGESGGGGIPARLFFNWSSNAWG